MSYGDNHAYHFVHHVTLENGQIESEHETNDDNDDGWPDGKIEHWHVVQKAKDALRPPYDRSHMGISGVMVRVWLDGKEIL